LKHKKTPKLFFDCSPESPKGRTSLCYDRFKTSSVVTEPVVSVFIPAASQKFDAVSTCSVLSSLIGVEWKGANLHADNPVVLSAFGCGAFPQLDEKPTRSNP
jgi:hypothetical protein